MKDELAKMITTVLESERYLPAYLPEGCELIRVGCEGKPENFRYIAVSPDIYPLIWDGNNWELPSPLIVNMIYAAQNMAVAKLK